MLTPLQVMLSDAAKSSAAERIFLGCSGGLDSQVLLHVSASLKESLPPVTVCFVDYGSSHSEAAKHTVQSLCDKHHLSFLSHVVPRKAPSGDNQEAYWRSARYAWFESLLQTNDVLMTAHHQADQAETVVLQLCRGAGLNGLSGMLPCRDLGAGSCWRPFLSVAHQTLIDYAIRHHVPYVNDPSNTDEQYSRNLIRHTVMPLLKKRWPAVETTLSRSAEHCQEAQALLRELAVIDTGIAGDIPFGEPLVCDRLIALSPARQRLAIRHWMSCQGVRMPTAIQLDELLKQLAAGPDKHPCVLLGDCLIRRHQKTWYLERRSP